MQGENQLRFMKTQGDEPVELIDEFPDSQLLNTKTYIEQLKQSLSHQSQDKENNTNNNNNNSDCVFRIYQQQQFQLPNDASSLLQLMGNKSPREFAQSYVFGKARPQASTQSTQKCQLTSKQQELVNRLASPNKSRYFGNDLSTMQNWTEVGCSQSVQPSKFTKMSEKIRETITQQDVVVTSPKVKQQIQFTRDQDIPITAFGSVVLSTAEISELTNRLAYEHQILQKKKDILKEKFIEDENKKCPFRPSINDKVMGIKEQVTRMKFYTNQQKLLEQYQERKQKLKDMNNEQIEKSLFEKPSISKKTKELAEKRRVTSGVSELNVVERLCTKPSKHSSNEKRRLETESQKSSNLKRAFSPEISARAMEIKRNKKVEQLLYEDAIKRREQKKSIALELETKASAKRSISSIFNSQINSKTSLRAFQSRFQKEFNESLMKVVPESENQDILNYEEYQAIMQLMYFAKQNSNQSEQQQAEQEEFRSNSEQKLSTYELNVQQIWCQLNGHCQQFILTRNLLIFLFALMNVYIESEAVPQLQEEIRLENLIEKTQPISASKDVPIKIPNQLMPDERQPEIETLNQYFTQQEDQVGKSNKKNYGKVNKMGKKVRFTSGMEQASENKFQHIFKELDFNQIGQFDQFGNMGLTESNANEIHRKYYDLCLNRLNSEKGNVEYRKLSKSPEPKYLYHPQLNEKTEVLASMKRERLINEIKLQSPKNVQIDLQFMLQYEKSQAEEKKKQLSQTMINKELEYCSFKPEINDYDTVIQRLHTTSTRTQPNKMRTEGNDEGDIVNCVNNNTATNNNNNNNDSSNKMKMPTQNSVNLHRTIQLYQLAKPHNQRRDRDKTEIEYEKQCDECTFSPDIQLNLKNNKVIEAMQQPMEKSVSRIKEGRLSKYTLEEIKNTGNTQFEKKRNGIEKKVAQIMKQQEHNHDRKNERTTYYQRQNANKQCNISELDKQPDTQRTSSKEDKDELNDLLSNNKIISDDKQNIGVVSSDAKNKKAKSEDERIPLLFVDVNIEEGKIARIVVFEGDQSQDLANKFALEHGLDNVMKGKLKELLDVQINSLLTKIDEEVISDTSSVKGDKQKK